MTGSSQSPVASATTTSHVQVLVADDRNRDLLADWLAESYAVTAPTDADEVTDDFDCCLVDPTAFARYRDRIETWKARAHPVFLPVVLVSDTLPSERLEPPDWDDIDGLYIVDEVIDTPVEQSVLYRRLANLIERRTLSRRLADDLERSEERFRALFDGTPDPVFVLSPDHELRYLNDALEELSDTDRSLVGSPLTALPPFSAGTAATIGELVDRRLAGDDTATRIVSFQTPDGETRAAELDVNVIETGAGTDAAIVMMRDVTERRERAERFQQIADSVSEVIWMVDADGEELLYLSPGFAELAGRATGGVGADPSEFLEFVHPDDREAYAEGLADLFRSRETGSREFEIRFERPDGEVRWAEVTVYAVTEGDHVRRYVGITEDITELKRREQDLEAKNERLDQFASLVSHDLRNPLQAAKTRLEIAQERAELDHLAHVERNLDRMDRLVSDILTLARQGETVTEAERVPLRTVAERAWDVVDHESAALAVETDATVDADPDRLVQLFENLFRNAVEHGSTSPDSQARQDADGASSVEPSVADAPEDAVEHPGTDVTVRIGRLPDDTGFYVEDDGPGIPAEERESIFDMGYSTRREGTGFGLPIVREIAEAHGWLAAVTDGTDGACGARFVFTNVDF